MVHEVFGIKNNRVDLSSAKGISKELQVKPVEQVIQATCSTCKKSIIKDKQCC